MNIFYLDESPYTSAYMHCDKHVVKMIIEYAQLLSTAHRLLDGTQYIELSKNRKVKRWKMSNKYWDDTLYKATHVNHPSAIWVRESKSNYIFLYRMFITLCYEYTHRYGKIHLTQTKLEKMLNYTPLNIVDIGITKISQNMPDNCKRNNPIDGYRTYYIQEKSNMLKYTNREIPNFINELLK